MPWSRVVPLVVHLLAAPLVAQSAEASVRDDVEPCERLASPERAAELRIELAWLEQLAPTLAWRQARDTPDDDTAAGRLRGRMAARMRPASRPFDLARAPASCARCRCPASPSSSWIWPNVSTGWTRSARSCARRA